MTIDKDAATLTRSQRYIAATILPVGRLVYYWRLQPVGSHGRQVIENIIKKRYELLEPITL